MQDFWKVILFLGMVIVILIAFIKPINKLLGGYDNCFICTPLHFNGYFSNWTITHYLAFLIVGYLAPKHIVLIIFLGIAWEVTEVYMEYISKTQHDHVLVKLLNLNCDTKLTPDQFWKHYFGVRKFHRKKTLFWCSGGFFGSVVDIIADIAGAYSGIYLSKIL